MSLLSPQGYSPGALGSLTDVSSPIVTFEPPLIDLNFNATSGEPPASAWNVSVSDGSWANWNYTTAHIASKASVFTSTPGSSITYFFQGTEYYIGGSFSGQNSSTVNGTLDLIIDGHTITSDSYGTNGGSGVNASIEGFGFNYGSQLPGSFGLIGGLNYDWHEITVKLNQGWMQVQALTGELLFGADGANTTLLFPGFLRTTADGGFEIDPSAVTTTGTWAVNASEVPSHYLATSDSGSTLSFITPVNTSVIDIDGYAGPDAGNYTVSLALANGTGPDLGSISWYGIAQYGQPAAIEYNAKAQWALTYSRLFYATLDQSKQYNVTVSFSGDSNERFAMGAPNFFVQLGPGTSFLDKKKSGSRVGAIAGGVVGAVVVLGLIATGLWYYRRRQIASRKRTTAIRMKTMMSRGGNGGYQDMTEMSDLKD